MFGRQFNVIPRTTHLHAVNDGVHYIVDDLGLQVFVVDDLANSRESLTSFHLELSDLVVRDSARLRRTVVPILSHHTQVAFLRQVPVTIEDAQRYECLNHFILHQSGQSLTPLYYHVWELIQPLDVLSGMISVLTIVDSITR